jgi:hypothetical protein
MLWSFTTKNSTAAVTCDGENLPVSEIRDRLREPASENIYCKEKLHEIRELIEIGEYQPVHVRESNPQRRGQ